MTGLIKIFAIPGQFLSSWAVMFGSTSIMSGLGGCPKVTHHLEAWGTASKAQAGFFTATWCGGFVYVDRPSGKVREREPHSHNPFEMGERGSGNRKMPVSTPGPVRSNAVPMAGTTMAAVQRRRQVDLTVRIGGGAPAIVGQRLQYRVSQGHRPARVDSPSPHLGQHDPADQVLFSWR